MSWRDYQDCSPEPVIAALCALIAALIVLGIGGCVDLRDDGCTADPVRCERSER